MLKLIEWGAPIFNCPCCIEAIFIRSYFRFFCCYSCSRWNVIQTIYALLFQWSLQWFRIIKMGLFLVKTLSDFIESDEIEQRTHVIYDTILVLMFKSISIWNPLPKLKLCILMKISLFSSECICSVWRRRLKHTSFIFRMWLHMQLWLSMARGEGLILCRAWFIETTLLEKQ